MKPIVLGYYADWNTVPTPAQLDYSLFTHLCHAFVSVEPDGNLHMPTAEQARDLTRRGKAAKVAVLLSLGGADSNTRLVAATATPASTDALADRLTHAVTDLGYAGLDVDWEAPENPEEQARMNRFVAALRKRMPGALLTMATPSTNWSGKWFTTDALASKLDFANVMTYDLYGPWSSRAGHNAGMGPATGDPKPDQGLTVPAAVDYWLKTKKWPKEKLALGIPLYGRGFRAAKWGDPAKGDYPRSSVSYKEVPKLITQGWKVGRDTSAGVPCLTSPDGAEVFSYEDPESARRKGEFAKKLGLAGVFFWEISQDFDGKSNPVVRAARDGLTK